MFARLRSLARALFCRRNFETGMAEELRLHMDQYADDLVRLGVPRNEAQRRAHMELGGMNTIEEECRRSRGLNPFDELTRQTRYAVRLLRKSPGFTSTALLTIAVCLGANVTIFAAIHAILLRPLPFPDPHRLVLIYNTYPKAGVERDGASITNYYERRGKIPALSSISIYRIGMAIVGESRSAARLPLMQVSPEFFRTLGTGPVFGRGFTDAETSYKTDNVAILSASYWREHFRADPKIIGRTVRVDSFPKTIVGVLPPGFRFLSSDPAIFLPLASSLEQRTPDNRHSGGNVTQMVARLAPGYSLAQAQSQMDAQNANLERGDPKGKMMAEAGFRSLVVPLRADHVASIRPALLLLGAGVFVLLLIAVANVNNLFLVRACGCAKEVAIRKALGAARSAIVREVLIETVTIALAGGLLSLGVGAAGIRLLRLLGASRLPMGATISLDGVVIVVSLAGAILLGLALAVPVIFAHLRHSDAALRSETRSATAGRGIQFFRNAFVVVQVALAFVLLTGSCLLALSLKQALAVSPGFEATHVLTGQVSLFGHKYPGPESGLDFGNRLTALLENQPGIAAAGFVNNVPLSGNTGKSAATVVGHVFQPRESPRGHYSYGVGGDYFKAMGFQLAAGRFLAGSDSRRVERVCVVDEDFARYYWPGQSALGHKLFMGASAQADNKTFTIVGVVKSVKQAGLTDDAAQGAVYYPYLHRADNNIFVAIRAFSNPEQLRRILERSVHEIDPELAVTDIRSMERRIDESLTDKRSPALLAELFAAIALLLTTIGTYGVLSYTVALRRREIGVRMALGARPEQIRNSIRAVTLRLFAAGSVLGIMGAWAMSKSLSTMLFHVAPFSSSVLAIAVLVMAAIGLAACAIPAWRAAQVSPAEALAEL